MLHVVHHHVVHVAHNHDDWPRFRIWFAVATVMASIVLNLGVFAVFVGVHMVLDLIKYRTRHGLSWLWSFIETLREGLVDLFFIVFGLLLGIAFHHSVAIGGLGRMAQLEVLLLNLILRIGPRLKIAEHLLEIVLHWKHHFEEQFAPHAPLRRTERWLLGAIIVCGASVLLTPLYTELTVGDLASTIRSELTPRLELGITHTLEYITPE